MHKCTSFGVAFIRDIPIGFLNGVEEAEKFVMNNFYEGLHFIGYASGPYVRICDGHYQKKYELLKEN